MIHAAAIITCLLAVLVLAHFILAGCFLWLLWNWRRPRLADGECPKAAVVLCLRGADPFLHKTIEAALQQDYPSYELHVVLDHVDDPARAVLDEVVKAYPNAKVVIECLTERRQTCSLKCSAVVQAASHLRDTHEVVAFLDADTIPHRTWLRELASALQDKKVGAVTGNRWYMPHDAAWGPLVRYIWNVPAVAQMALYHIAWGGTLAVRASVFRDTDLLEKWSNAFCEDTMLCTQLKRYGLKLRFVPSLMMVNRETTSLGDFCRWVSRQLLCAKLYHPAFWMVILHSLTITLFPLAALILLAIALAIGDSNTASIAGAGVALYLVSLPFLLTLLEVAVRRIVHARREATGWWTPGILIRLLPAFVLTHFWYAPAMVAALTLRRVEWRGVHYQVDGPWQIKMLDYTPFTKTESPNSQGSL